MRLHRACGIVAASVVGLLACAKGAGAQPPNRTSYQKDLAEAAVHIVKFQTIADHIYVPIQINGFGVMAMLDTGAVATIVSEQTAMRAEAKVAVVVREGVVQLVTNLNSLRIAGLTFRHVSAIVKTRAWKSVPAYGGEAFSPLVFGLSMKVDYARQEISLATELPAEEAQLALPLWFRKLPIVRAMVDRHAAAFVVDTGAQATVVAQSIIDRVEGLDAHRVLKLILFDSAGRRDSTCRMLVPGPAIDIGILELPRRPVITMDLSGPSRLLGFEIGGLLGHSDLQKYVVTFDLARGALRLARDR